MQSRSPSGDVVDLGLAKGACLGSLHARVLRDDVGVRCPGHDVRKELVEKLE